MVRTLVRNLLLIQLIALALIKAKFYDTHILKLNEFVDENKPFLIKEELDILDHLNLTLRIDFVHINEIIKPIYEHPYPKQDFEPQKFYKTND